MSDFDKSMKKFLNGLLNEQAPDTIKSSPAAGLAPAAQQQDTQYPETPVTRGEPEPVPAGSLETKYLDTRRMFYTKEPPDAGEWVKELDRHPEYRRLVGEIGPFLQKQLGKNAKITQAGAARYRPNQFRITLTGNFECPTVLNFENQELSLNTIEVPGLRGMNKIERAESKAKPISFKPSEIPPEEPKAKTKFKGGELASEKDIESMVSQFAESQIYEVRLEQPKEQIKGYAWKQIEPHFKEWFVKQVIEKNPKSFVENAMSTKEGREKIKLEFLKFARRYPKVDKHHLEKWVEAAGIEKKEKEAPEEDMRKNAISFARKNFKMNVDDAEKFVDKAFEKETPEDEKEMVSVLYKAHAKGMEAAGKFKKDLPDEKETKEERLETYLKKLLLEVKKPKEMGRMLANVVAKVNQVIDHETDGWIQSGGSLFAELGGDMKQSGINWLAADEIYFDLKRATYTKDGRKLDRDWDEKAPLTLEGTMKVKGSMLVDARMQAGGRIWEFRTMQNINDPVVKGFGAVGKAVSGVRGAAREITKEPEAIRKELAQAGRESRAKTQQALGGKVSEI